MNDEVNCTRLAGTVGRALLCKQCICSHKYQKQIFGGYAENLLLLVGGSRPQTPFRRISFCGYAPFRRFFSHLRQRFLENGKVGLPT